MKDAVLESSLSHKLQNIDVIYCIILNVLIEINSKGKKTCQNKIKNSACT
jgi:hypothetical protein